MPDQENATVTVDMDPEDIRDPKMKQDARRMQMKQKNKSILIRDKMEMIKKLKGEVVALRTGKES